MAIIYSFERRKQQEVIRARKRAWDCFRNTVLDGQPIVLGGAKVNQGEVSPLLMQRKEYPAWLGWDLAKE